MPFSTKAKLRNKNLISIFIIILLLVITGCSSDDKETDLNIDADKDGYTVTAGDCNDHDVTIYPGAPEVCGDGIDQDCNGADLPCDTSDADGDGYTVTAGDCNDNDATINPGATEIGCDGIDQDCNGSDLTVCTYYKDNDGDKYGNPNIFLITTQPPLGSYVSNNSDCNDNDATFNPGETELCDGKDNNCSGIVDEGCSQVTYFKDGDNDTYVIFSDSVTQAPPPPSTYIADPHYGVADCDDTDATIFPGATEVADDGIDQDCNGTDLSTGCTSCHSQAEFITTGHGRTTGTYVSGNPAANGSSTFAGCTSYCHTDTVGHSTTTNPYRLTTAGGGTDFSDPGSASDNLVCLDCHASDGLNNPLAAVYIGALADANKHFGTKHSTQTEGGNFCWDCHDPHGDANDYMIQNSVTTVSDGQYGVAVTAAAVTFPDTSGTYDWAAYINDTTFDGICQICHTGTVRFTNSGSYDAAHNAGKRCTNCHDHSTGFAPAVGTFTCADCHTQANFATTGHGKTTGTYTSGNSAANFTDCTTNCHIDTTGTTAHFTVGTPAGNPFRLTSSGGTDFSDPGSASDNLVCLDCHASDGTSSGSASTYIGALANANKHYGTKHSAQTEGGNFCWDCHNPHGGASNAYMVSNAVTTASDGQYGRASATSAVTFTKAGASFAWGDYVKNTTFDGLCQICHTGTVRFTNSGSYDAAHNAGKRCTNCHSHDVGFEITASALACTVCHSQVDFTTTGHGLASGAYSSGNPAANSGGTFPDCITYCHIDTTASADHTTVGLPATNPFRLTASSGTDFSDASSANDNLVCLDCHASDGTNKTKATVYTGALADSNKHFGTLHSLDTEGGNFCWDCHDPHGDSNDYMIHDSVSTASDGTYGRATATAAVTFPDTIGVYDWAAYVNDSIFDGLCQICHTGTVRFTNSGSYDATHYAGNRCTICHDHTPGFEVDASSLGCTICHTGPQAEFTTTGHGKPSGAYTSGNPAANFADCTTNCHIDTTGTSAHFTVGTPAGNPFRLTSNGGTDFSDSGSASDNLVCLDCHASDGTSSGSATTHIGLLADPNKHFGTLHSLDTEGGNFCWDCHDPHGDANAYMIKDAVTTTSDGQYGRSSATSAVTFTKAGASFAWGDYVKDMTFDGICQICHTSTARFRNNGLYDATHRNGNRCTYCHNHSTGFEVNAGALVCTECHNKANFTTSGHGKTSGIYISGNPAANSGGIFVDCLSYCHIDTTGTSAHFTVGIPADNPLRLQDAVTNQNFTDSGSGADNLVCLDCHATDGTNSAQASTDVGVIADPNNHFGAKHSAQTESGNFCWDCHDPHGSANAYMIQSFVTTTSDGEYGKSAATSAVAFTKAGASFAWGDYVNDPTFDGLCQICHTGTTRFKNNGLYDATHYSGARCTSCHAHNIGFAGVIGGGAGSDCKTCHNTGGIADTGTGGSAGNRRGIEVDFSKTYRHGYAWGDASFDPLDCELCHFLDNHGGGTVQMKQWTGAAAWSGTPVDYDPTDLTTMNAVCLSCHDSGVQGDDLQNTNYGQIDIADRWNDTTTGVAYNKYADGGTNTYPNSVPTLNKAYSPHRLPASNDAKADMDMTAAGLDSRSTNTVACLDCHPAHGSDLGSGVNGTLGEANSYMLEDYGSYTTEEALCWGCHDYGMDYYGEGSSGAADWQGKWDESIAAYKNGYDFLSSHFYPSGNGAVTWTNGVPSGTRNTIYCSTCHNPHGISSTNDSDHAYRVPILRGTWLTSPYKEDRAPGSVTDITDNTWNNDVGNTPDPDGEEFGPLPRATSAKVRAEVEPGGGYATTQYTAGQYASGFTADRNGYDGYFIDQNTFGNGTYITEIQSEFAGLCLICHPKNNIEFADSGGRDWTGHSAVKWDNIASFVTYSDTFMGAAYSGSFTNATDDIYGGDFLDHDGGSEWAFLWYGGVDTGTPDDGFLDVNYGHNKSNRAYGSREDGSELSNGPPGEGSPRTPTVNDKRIQENWNVVNSWGVSWADQTNIGGSDPYVQKSYHQFPCSKCHTPHASRLPRLMRTNCLDNGSNTSNTNESTTDYTNDYSLQSTPTGIHTPAGNSYDNIAGDSGSFTNPGPNLMNYEAVNCHSVGGSSSGGWNRITPWVEGVQPSNP